MKKFSEWMEIREEIEGRAGQYRPMHGGYPGTIQNTTKAMAYDQHGLPVKDAEDIISSKSKERGQGNVGVASYARSTPRKGTLQRLLFGPQKTTADDSAGAYVAWDGKGNREDIQAPDGGRMYHHRDDAPGSANRQMIRKGLRPDNSKGLERLGYTKVREQAEQKQNAQQTNNKIQRRKFTTTYPSAYGPGAIERLGKERSTNNGGKNQ